MQILQSGGPAIHVGDKVRNRGQRWLISSLERFDEVFVVTLTGIDGHNHGVERRLLSPFDRLEPIATQRRLQIVGRARWRHACRALIAGDGAAPILRTALTARMQVLPYQLEPALAIVRGLGSRVLIADAVGLGKTVQAGLIVSELRARHAASRTLILTPAGVRDQWIEELDARFDLKARLFDAPGIRARQRALPVGVNPWTTETLVIASIDFVKQSEILRAVAAVRWDVVVVDEAHGAIAPSDRHGAAEALCRMASHVVLLTATPHSGDEQSFASLCGIGGRDDRLLVFRRRRADAGLAETRRIHQLVIQPTEAERRLQATLQSFGAAIERDSGGADDRVALVLSMLRKRARSSASSLERSLHRRLALLEGAAPVPVAQLALPFDTDGELDGDDAMPEWRIPVLRDASEERAWLTQLAADARSAADGESKLRALARLLRRIPEPVIVFTEYRDTLAHVREQIAPHAILLHGGLSRDERRAALGRFGSGGVLLATDAAGQGLNLHNASRVVINLELPWNPMRLEQRIGRVDRIGQTRRVHAFHLIGAHSDEVALRDRLHARIAVANAAIGAADPLRSPTNHADRMADMQPMRLLDESAREAARIERNRSLGKSAASVDEVLDAAPLVSSAHRLVRTKLPGRTLVLLASSAVAWNGESLAIRVTAITCKTPHRCLTLADLDRLPLRVVDAGLAQWTEETSAAHHAFWSCRLRRLEAIARDFSKGPARSQPGLFDLRATHAYRQQHQASDEARRTSIVHIDAARRWLPLLFNPMTVVLALTP